MTSKLDCLEGAFSRSLTLSGFGTESKKNVSKDICSAAVPAVFYPYTVGTTELHCSPFGVEL